MGTPQRVLIVGGNGLIGAHASAAFAAAGHRVTVITRTTPAAGTGIESLIADRADGVALARALEGRSFDVTVDLCAYDAADVERLLLVPHAALGRIAMISTGQVYLVTRAARTPYREEDSEQPLIEEPARGTPDHDNWTYGMGKRRAEGVVLSLRATHGVRAVVLRLPIVIGAGDRTLRLWSYVERLLDGGPILMPDGGARPTRFIWAGDVARVLVQLAEGPLPRMAVYNLAPPEVVPVRALVERVAREVGVAPRFVDVPAAELQRAGIPRSFSPFASPWVSVLDPSRVAAEWGFSGERADAYLPRVVRALLDDRPENSHAGYVARADEIALAARLGAAVG